MTTQTGTGRAGSPHDLAAGPSTSGAAWWPGAGESAADPSGRPHRGGGAAIPGSGVVGVVSLPRPCLRCGQPGPESYCAEHRPARAPERRRGRPQRPHRWRKFSTKVRRAQPWCIDCGAAGDTTPGGSLTTDHLISELDGGPLMPGPEGAEIRCRPCHGRKTGADRRARAERDEPGGGTPDPKGLSGRGVRPGADYSLGLGGPL